MNSTRSILPVLALVGGAMLAASGALADTSVTIVQPEAPSDLDPCSMGLSNVGRILKENVVETLTEVNPNDGSVTPRLAREWVMVDPKTWRFELRDGVKFHDGSDFDAEDVAHSIARLQTDGFACETRGKSIGILKLSTNIIDKDTVEVVASDAVPILPTIMGTIPMVPVETPLDAATRNPVGTGPYRLASWTPEQVVIERFDGYWGDRPVIDSAKFVTRTESAIRAAMVATGEADIASSIAAQDADDPDKDFSYFNSETTRFSLTVGIPPLDDVRVRKALNLAVDRKSLLGSLFPPDAAYATQINGPNISGYNPDLKVWPYDPDEAKRLLDEARAAGVPVDTEIHIICRNGIYPNATEVCEALLGMWSAVGLNVDLTVLEVGEWLRYAEKPFPANSGPYILQMQQDNSNGDAVFLGVHNYHSTGATSTASDPVLDKLIESATAATGEERIKLWHQVFARIDEELILEVPLFHMVGYSRVNPRLDWHPTIATNSEIQIARIKFH